MLQRMLISWFSVVVGLLFIFGLVFAFTDMRSLPVSNEAVLPWVTGVLGATMMG
jgi:Na+-transporting NADH:ubiquinone oxidoreductase subunit NqrB